MACVRFDFGKHCDRPVEDVPTSYLRWCLRECECLTPWLRSAVEAELARRAGGGPRERGQPRPPVDWPAVIQGWYRSLCLDFHPDRGGSKEAMQAINEAHDRLRRLLEVA
jgi:hypothetical protein